MRSGAPLAVKCQGRWSLTTQPSPRLLASLLPNCSLQQRLLLYLPKHSGRLLNWALNLTLGVNCRVYVARFRDVALLIYQSACVQG